MTRLPQNLLLVLCLIACGAGAVAATVTPTAGMTIWDRPANDTVKVSVSDRTKILVLP